MTINKKDLTREQLEKAMRCKTADELMKLAEAEGFDITKEEAEVYMAELADYNLDEEALQAAVGGTGPYDAQQDGKK
jgi:predicted ribosomally synthesized peptide with nif11-like leader